MISVDKEAHQICLNEKSTLEWKINLKYNFQNSKSEFKIIFQIILELNGKTILQLIDSLG